jgi:hypothetical protein
MATQQSATTLTWLGGGLIALLFFGSRANQFVANAAAGAAAAQQAAGAAPSPAPPAPPPTTASKFPDPKAQRYRTAADLVHDFFGDSGSVLSSVRHRYRVNILIALVPDPIDSHLDWAYDAELESIRRAYERSGYLIDRFWLPWPAEVDTSARGMPNHMAVRALHPGVMLFRRQDADSDRKLSLVYLIGEVPTGGVHKPALRAALEERDRIMADTNFMPNSAVPDTVRIVGPTFSGSALSLRLVLDDWLSSRAASSLQAVRHIEIVSGSATSSINKRILDVPAESMAFSAALNPDDYLVGAVNRFFAQTLRIPSRQIAYLHEGTTQYGQTRSVDSSLCRIWDPESTPADSCGRQSTSDRQGMDSMPSPVSGAGSLRTDNAAAQLRNVPIDISFPMNISSVRSEYARLPPVAAATPPLPGQTAPRIPLDLAEPAWTTESPAVVSDLTPAAVDLAVDEIMGTLVAHNVRIVEIVATDVRDQIFLADEIRKRMRDVTLVMFGSNILMLRPDLNGSLRGTYIVSTYPLFVENQYWDLTHSDRAPSVFVLDAAEATYNATLFQLGAGGAAVDYALPLTRSPDSLRRPPIWVTVVGRNAFAPVFTVAVPSDSLRYVHLRAVRAGPRSIPSRQASFVGFSVLMGLAAFLWLASLVAMQSRAAEQVKRVPAAGGPATAQTVATTDSASVGRTVQRASLMLHREIYVGLRSLALGGVLVLVALVLLRPIARGIPFPPRTYLVWLPAAIAGALVLSRSILQGLTLVRSHSYDKWYHAFAVRWKNVPSRVMWRVEIFARALIVTIGVVYACLIGLFVAQALGLKPIPASLFFLRTVALTSGVSPALPLILGGLTYAAWCTWHLRRVSLLSQTTAYEEAWLGDEAPMRPQQAVADTARSSAATQAATRSPLMTPVIVITRELESAQRMRDRLADAGEAVTSVRSRLLLLVPSFAALVLLGVLLLVGVVLNFQFGNTIESSTLSPLCGARFCGGMTPFDVLFRLALFAAIGATVWGIYRFLAVWQALRACLACVAESGLAGVFSRLPKSVTRVIRLTPLHVPSRHIVDSAVDGAWNSLDEVFKANDAAFAGDSGKGVRAFMKNGTFKGWIPYGEAVTLGDRYAELNAQLTTFWKTVPPLPADEPDDSTARAAPLVTDATTLWVRAAERLEALLVVAYLAWVFRHLRSLAAFLLVALILTMLLLDSYPFFPQNLIKLLFFFVFVGTVGSLLLVLAQMNKDPILTGITKTTVTWNTPFAAHLVVFGALPILALLGSWFPPVGSFLFAWVAPLVRVIGGG